MPITILASQVFDKPSAGATAYTVTGFAVPAGTDCLVALVLFRNYAAVATPAVSANHNGDVLTNAGATAGAGGNDINTAWLYRRNPDIGTFDVDLGFATQVRGCAVWLLALSGVKASGSPFGATADSQTVAPTATDTVSLGLTPAATADSLLLAALGICPYATTLTTWTGGGFTEQATGQYTANGLLTSTFRYRNAGPASAQTVSAKFGASDTNIGGVLLEVLAQLASVDVTGAVSLSLSVAGGIAGPASAGLADASFLSGAASWTDLLLLQADDVAVDRRIISAGPAGAATLTLDAVAAGAAAANVFRWRARLADGVTQAETGAGTQSAAPRHLALVRAPGRTDAYVDGERSESAASGEALLGQMDVGSGPIEVAGHAAASPGPFTGLLGRWLRYSGVLSDSQIRLMARSLLAPERIWGIGAEDDAQVPGQGPIALPQDVLPDGRAALTVVPTVIRPDGVPAAITAVTQPAHGTVAISGESLQLNLERGWQGADFFTFTVTGSGGKTSTARVTIIQARPALLARGDSITVAQNGSVIFNPRANDIGAGPLSTIGVTVPANGTAQIQPDGRIRYAPTTGYAGADGFNYTVADEWGQQTAAVAVAVTASSFVNASDDEISTPQGVAVDIDVLGNDQASAALLPLEVVPGSITAPSPSGTAALLANQRIRYTPASGASGIQATFGYTAKPAAAASPTSAATVRVTVGGSVSQEYPAATGQTWTVGSRAELDARYGAAAGGDHIIVRNGVDLGGFTFGRNGANAGRPIVIRVEGNAPAINAAFFSGTVSITGSYNMLWGLRPLAQRLSMGINATGSRIRRLLFAGARIASGATHPWQCPLNGRGQLVEYCEMTDSDARGFALTSDARACKILHCYIHDFIVNNPTDQTYEPIQIGEGSGTYNGLAEADRHEIGWIFGRNCNQNNKESEFPSVKRSYTYMHDVHLIDCKDPTFRFAHDGRFERVRCEGGSAFVVHGPRNVLNSCWVESGGIEIWTGTWDASLAGDPPGGAAGGGGSVYPSTIDTRLIGCKGQIKIGHGGKPLRALRTRIEAHVSGGILNEQGGAPEWTQVATASEPIATPPSYTATSQGLWAGL